MKQKNTYFQRLTFSTNVTSETLFCYIHEIGKCVFKRLTFSTNVASEGLVTFMKLENVFSQTNIFHKCHTCKTYHFHEIGKYVFKRLTFSTNVTSQGRRKSGSKGAIAPVNFEDL